MVQRLIEDIDIIITTNNFLLVELGSKVVQLKPLILAKESKSNNKP